MTLPMLEAEVAPAGLTSELVVRVPFFDTDAMGVVHHSNYLRYLELLRVRFLEEHDQPYERYMQSEVHIAVTRAEVEYLHPCRFNDELRIVGTLTWIKHLTLQFRYVLSVAGTRVATAVTEHAALDGNGKLRRWPSETRRRLARSLATTVTPDAPPLERAGE